MESWMINLGIAAMGIAVTYGIMKNKIDVMSETNKEKDKKLEALHKRLDTHGDDIVKLNTRAELSMTAKDVDDKYVSKEIFKQMERSINVRIDATEKHLIDKVDSLGKSIEKSLTQVMTNQMALAKKLDNNIGKG